jgi:hypothetical protein
MVISPLIEGEKAPPSTRMDEDQLCEVRKWRTGQAQSFYSSSQLWRQIVLTQEEQSAAKE